MSSAAHRLIQRCSRHKLKTIAFAAGSSAAASAYRERPSDAESLPRHYDPQAIADHWKERPWAVRRRCYEILRLLGPLAGRFVYTWRQGAFDDVTSKAFARELRLRLEDCGPTFIKLGQALSSRPDLLPAMALKELQRLCDECAAFPWEQAREVMEADLGSAPDAIFSGVGETPAPIAAASLGQVYRWTFNGRTVAVKVQRPGMQEQVSLDLYILLGAAALWDWLMRRLTKQRVDHVALVDAWAGGTWAELDYEAEATNQERFKQALKARMPNDIYVPEVVRECSSQRVLVTEWIEGPKLASCTPEIINRLVPVGLECFLAQLLELGLFHGDPHPGNLLVRDGKQLVLLDFGLIANVDAPNRKLLTWFALHLIRGEWELLYDDLLALGFLPDDVDRNELLPVLSAVLGKAIANGSNLRRRAHVFKSMSDDLNQIFYEFPFMVPAYFALITRAVTVLEGE
eukprot:TRINITY_DN28632_c0_g1_i1.p1 TRINITY_DN28632_c0_g1~~TRINITY_DN28632_c0_g1_i1.p1  ORF type:complete len:459 (+),score=71.01 TRINITY_DN28632_c0_g1_i1:106-1482(+)